jgi:hypothetical protein
VAVSVVDTDGNQTTCDSTIVVQDTIPPVICGASAYPDSLWPPNHKMVPIRLWVVAKAACCLAGWKIVSVTSNESSASPEWIITGDQCLSLLADRNGKGNGRVYTITLQAEDCSGNLSAPATLKVTVPHDQGRGDFRFSFKTIVSPAINWQNINNQHHAVTALD